MPLQYFTAPYAQVQRGLRLVRVCDILNFQAQIEADDGDLVYAEIDGNQALCQVRASLATLVDLTRAFTRVTDPVSVWTPTRRTWQNVGGEIVLHPTRTVANKDLSTLDAEILTEVQHAAMKALAEAYMTRAQQGEVVLIDRDRTSAFKARLLKYVGRLGFGFDRIKPGTFPTQPVLDDFNRGDNTTLGANWANHRVIVYGGTTPIDGSITSSVNTTNGGCAVKLYYSDNTYGPDSEAYITVVSHVAGDSHEVGVRIQQPGDATFDGYDADCTSGNNWHTYVVTNGASVQIGVATLGSFTNGDKLGIEAISTSISRYRHTGGSWALQDTADDGTVTAAGYLSLYQPGTSGAFSQDDFGGGTVGAVAGGPQASWWW